jgi:hypothetical protein
MSDMTNDRGHLNGIAKSIGICPDCREKATEKELAFAAEWMRLRGAAYHEQVAHARGLPSQN